MLRTFTDPHGGYPGWLATHPDGFVVTMEREADGPPRRADGRMDMAALWTGAPRSADRLLHRATCDAIKMLGPEFTKVCGTRYEIENAFRKEELRRCRVCG